MTSLIDEVLARARLRDDDFAYHYLPTPAPSPDPDPVAGPPPATPAPAPADPERRSRRAVATSARRDLTTLCETAITQAGLDHLTAFLNPSLVPEPDSARTLGCYLHLGHAHDGARFWWQFAAGAGDHTAAYCLYLQHLSMEETAPAAWWQAQTPSAAPREAPPTPTPDDTSLPTTLRILRQLKLHRSRHTPPPPPLEQDTIDYITHAVSYVDDDLELPLPETTFTSHIHALSCRHTRLTRPTTPPPDRTATPLPLRPQGKSAIRTATQHSTDSVIERPRADLATAAQRWFG
ncbi:hypothetical protein [Streptomyces sp. SGAir0957]